MLGKLPTWAFPSTRFATDKSSNKLLPMMMAWQTPTKNTREQRGKEKKTRLHLQVTFLFEEKKKKKATFVHPTESLAWNLGWLSGISYNYYPLFIKTSPTQLQFQTALEAFIPLFHQKWETMTVLPFTFTTERLVQHIPQLPSRHHPSSMLYSAHPGTTQAQCCMYSAHPGTTKVQCCTLPILAPPKCSAVLCPSWHHPSSVLYSAHPSITQFSAVLCPSWHHPS